MAELQNVILTSTYFGSVQWYQKLNRAENILIEQHDNYCKQTYRNRCLIAGANGVEALTIPVERPSGTPLHHTAMKDMRISDHGNWRHVHWNALVAAYSDSAFFEYYADDIRQFYEKRWDYLLDYNEAIYKKMCNLLDVDLNGKRIMRTEQYGTATGKTMADGITLCSPQGGVSPDDFADYREVIDPKHPLPDSTFCPIPYYQVFAHKHGFIPNLSILDLLFNMGPEAILYL